MLFPGMIPALPDARSILRGLALAVACVLSVAVFFHAEIANGFNLLNGDRYDAVIALSIMEHWRNVIHGLEPVWTTNYFYPVPGTLGYNDGFLVTGVIYTVVRGLGADPYLAGELVAVALRTICFAGVYGVGRRVLRLSSPWSAFSAAIVTLAGNMTVQAVHEQLFTIAFAPLATIILAEAVDTFLEREQRRFLLWSVLGAMFFGAWLLTAFYTAWFFALFAILYGLALYVVCSREKRASASAILREQAWLIAAALGFVLLSVLPFLSVYLPKALETGQHRYAEALGNTPSLLDLANVGGGNLVFGHWLSFLTRPLGLAEPGWSELQSAISPGLLLLFAITCVWAWWNPATSLLARGQVVSAICLAVLASLLLIVHIGGYSAWSAVYVFIPGSHAIRVVARYQLFLVMPVSVIVARFLAEHSRAFGPVVTAAICAFLLLEEVNVSPPLDLHRDREVAFLNSVPSAPKSCKAFFVTSARREGQSGAYIDGIYSHNVDAMIIAETRDLPTLNGFGSFLPPRWDLTDPNRTGYQADVRRFAQQYGVSALCALDLRTNRWKVEPARS